MPITLDQLPGWRGVPDVASQTPPKSPSVFDLKNAPSTINPVSDALGLTARIQRLGFGGSVVGFIQSIAASGSNNTLRVSKPIPGSLLLTRFAWLTSVASPNAIIRPIVTRGEMNRTATLAVLPAFQDIADYDPENDPIPPGMLGESTTTPSDIRPNLLLLNSESQLGVLIFNNTGSTASFRWRFDYEYIEPFESGKKA